MPALVVRRPVLREIADVVEQLFTIAATCDLRNVTPEGREAAIRAFET